MMAHHRKVFTFYQRKRVVNVNVNATAGGLAAIVIGSLLLKIVHRTLPEMPKLAYAGIGFAADAVADVALYFALHWVANHWRPIKGHSEKEQTALEAERPPFWKDAGRVQLERIVLSPVFYLLSVSGHYLLQLWGMDPSWAMLLSYSVVLLITRAIHTVWGLRSGTLVDHVHRENGNGRAPAADPENRGPDNTNADNLEGTAPGSPPPSDGAGCADSPAVTGDPAPAGAERGGVSGR